MARSCRPGRMRDSPLLWSPKDGEKFAIDLDSLMRQGRRGVIHSFMHVSSTPVVENPAPGRAFPDA